ncbi:MAG: hypothetical protein LUD19_00750 [Clostridia bacterium]|nr:hypothetical protein [Clostridia bacterium]
MNKNVITKIILITLGLIIALAIVVFAVLSLAAPGVMAGWCEETGNYSLAVSYASLHYRYTGNVKQAARCAQDSILAENNKYIIKYGEQLIDHTDFDSYCTEQDEYYLSEYNVDYSYRQFIYGEVSVAYYSKGDAQSAVGCAIQALDADFYRSTYQTDGSNSYSINSFPDSNALITLSLKVINNSDDGAAGYILQVLENISAEGEELVKLEQFTAIINSVAQGTYTN